MIRPPLFSFAVIADTHLNPEGMANTSPWRTNRLANARNQFLVEELKRLRPAFVVHMGDIVHPLPSNPHYVAAADFAKKLFAQLPMPFHLVPGNHDVGDKPLDWMPADRITSGFVAKFRAAFGDDWGAFEYGGCRFIHINSSLLNSGLPEEAAQKGWLEGELAAAVGQRIFFFTHYPPFIARPDEDSHYDNLDEPKRGWLLDLLARHKIEALFAGHVHNFFYNRHGATRCYVLPSVTSLRQDYSEFARIGPAEEYGRNDTAKLGYFVVDVYPEGHVARFVRTAGATLDTLPDGMASREAVPSPVGAHLRHPWAEEVELPHNAPLDELGRKRARNDYGLLAMWDIGLMKLRVPLSDLRDQRIRGRMADYCDLGRRFTVFSFGVPDRSTLDTMCEHRALVDRWELILPLRNADAVAQIIKPLRAQLPSVFFSKLWGHDGNHQDASTPFDHSITLGFDSRALAELEDMWGTTGIPDAFAGAVFKIEPGDFIHAAISTVADAAERLKLRAMACVKLGPVGSAGTPPSEVAVANRVAEAVLCSWCYPVEIYLDTFQEIDRGYFLRPGLVDRRCNPSLAGRVFRELQLDLARLEPNMILRESEDQWDRGIVFRTKQGHTILKLPKNAGNVIPRVEALETPASSRIVSA